MLSQKLIDQTLNNFTTHSLLDFVVRPSLPILYFGNLDEYSFSSLKVITVGKNPSNNEFRLNNTDQYSYCRFNKWKPEKGNLIEALNPYIEDKPLSWFSCYEPVLNGMGCSYYPGKIKNRVLHTDICSPIATTPTWSKLTPQQQCVLSKEGNILWNLLIEALQPDIILISVPRQLFLENFDETGKTVITFDTKVDGSKRTEPYRVFEHIKRFKNGKVVKVFFGPPAQTPFGTISSDQKMEVGKSCLQ